MLFYLHLQTGNKFRKIIDYNFVEDNLDYYDEDDIELIFSKYMIEFKNQRTNKEQK